MLLRRLLQLAFALALVVVGASATLRLAANGIGCEPWPACYGGADTAAAANATPLARALRLSHRIAASAFALVALAAVALGWRRWASGQRIAGAAGKVGAQLFAPNPQHGARIGQVLDRRERRLAQRKDRIGGQRRGRRCER